MELSKTEIQLLDELEKKYNLNIRKANADDIVKLLNDEEFQLDFSSDDPSTNDQFTKILNLLGRAVDDKPTRDVINASSITYKLVLSRSVLDNLFHSFEDNVYTRDEFVELIKSEIESDDPIISINAMLINYESSLNLKISSEKVVENLKKIRSFSEDIETNKMTYLGKNELIDLLCYFLDSYFVSTGIKICKENPDIWDWLKREIMALHKVEDEDFFRPNEFDLPEDSANPEELGLIDITKLKKNGEKK